MTNQELCPICNGDGVAYEPHAGPDAIIADTCWNCGGSGFVDKDAYR